MKAFSIRKLARQTGYSVATVSKALRDHPDIRLATRQEIWEAARQKGYHRNARISDVMKEIRDPATSRTYDIVACLVWSLDPQWIAERAAITIMLEAARKHAETLGWKLQTFSLNDPALPRAAIGRVLHSRGIQAAVLLPVETSAESLGIDYSRLAAVAIGYSVSHPMLCRVGRSTLDSMELLFHQLRQRGYRRPGLAVGHNEILRTHRHYLAGFVNMQQELPARNRLPPLIWKNFDKKVFLRWLEHHQPDVVLGENAWLVRVLRKASYQVPDHMGVALITRLATDGGIAGLNPNYEVLAESAVNLATQMASQAKFGIPPISQNLLVVSSWCEGETLRKPLPFSS